MATTNPLIGGMLGGWEIVLILTIALFLFLVRMSVGPSSRNQPHLAAFTQADFLLWIAEGCGVGRIPFGPGTFGSVLGIFWFALLLGTHRLWLLLAGAIAGIAVSVWLCGVAEKMLRETDPGSVVLDEIAAMPLCFFAWIGIYMWSNHSLPALEEFFGARTWPMTFGVFAAFRFFDVIKPWPVRQSQSLPGGWGITVDDVLAAIYVNLLTLAVYAAKLLVPGTH